MTTKDPGLAQERTALSWRRTSLTLIVAAVISVRTAENVISQTGIGVTLTGAALVALHAGTSVPGPAHPGRIALLAVSTSVASLLAVVNAITG